MVIGNSSSGIIEAPSFHVPTVNIGNRQKGRIQAASVLNCICRREAISASIHTACDEAFLRKIKDVENPYGNGGASRRIFDVIKAKFIPLSQVDVIKSFYDVDIKL
jgi:GDP/UDP-N,N'-diacetylbacillosamine 2-epimerase (hydrolysing)